MLCSLSSKTHCGETPCRLHALGVLTGEVRVSHFGLETCPSPCQPTHVRTWPKPGTVTLGLTEQAESKMWLGKISCICTRGGGRWSSEGGCAVPCPSHWWHGPGLHCVSGLDKPLHFYLGDNRAVISEASQEVKNYPKPRSVFLQFHTQGRSDNFRGKCNFWHHLT